VLDDEELRVALNMAYDANQDDEENVDDQAEVDNRFRVLGVAEIDSQLNLLNLDANEETTYVSDTMSGL